MKAAFGTIGFVGGFLVSLAMFAIGVVTATWFLAAEPVRDVSLSDDVDRLWAVTPRRIDTATQDLERLPPTNQGPAAPEPQGVDPTATASVQPDTTSDDPSLHSDAKFAAHVEWCQRRYRSYRTNDNTYTSFDGDDRPCVSPHSGDLPGAFQGTATDGASDEPVAARYAMDETSGGFANDDHANYCFSRYRSYRPADNSYQPFGGGPRQQCQ